ncbi:MAG: hypothetical protein KAG97_07985 [Victivallales bacterium]|nr:hypothetical protein [Victivallales bacterium]
MEQKLIVSIRYLVEGDFPDTSVVLTIREHAVSFGLGGGARVFEGRLEMTLEGAPESIGEFLACVHSRLPRSSRIHRIVPMAKTVIQSAVAKFVVYGAESESAPAAKTTECGSSYDSSGILNDLSSGKVVRIVVNGSECPVVDAFNATACFRLLESEPESSEALLFSDVESVFKHFKFSADAVKSFMSNQKNSVRLALRPDSRLRLSANLADAAEAQVMIADPATVETLFAFSDIEALAVIV